MTVFSIIALFLVALPLAYLGLLALASASFLRPKTATNRQPSHRFIIAIPAHNEANVIATSIRQLQALNYPKELFSIHVVADHCSDKTAEIAREAGAFVHERNAGPRTGKGMALSWLFQRVLSDEECDAVGIFDADTSVDPNFLQIMDARLAQGDLVIQGQHLISNPDSGWYPSLAWAMFLVDNRFQNLGRTNLGWSAKNMGDSICFRADILRKIGWGQGLTEDYQLRQRLLLEGVKITYEPTAIGRGEAPLTWAQARVQRMRWLRGTRESSQQFARRLLVEGLKRRDTAILDGALQAYLPSYSTLTMFGIMFLLLQLLINWQVGPIFSGELIGAWMAIVGALFIYPLIGLAFEKAPLKAYLAILSGMLFIIWRSWLALKVRFGKGTALWIRTAHVGEP
jgi:cellulose synthase/poly-beta-1,6-N-acetylglucosamine synthase-like glycosyltransferase